MPFKSSCLSHCGTTVEGTSPREVGVRLKEHMEEAHDIPVDPLEVSEFAIEYESADAAI
ncbi:DUF1059 domain-containing protein [Haloferax profundi]|uniref:DUF1059 domain-containing protein n=1 Tax=Haloferax profundi TaxID=1544718 RepID=UPI0009E90E33|nr:DUF1059 domain-containing protein [Haloferax profundi]